MEELRKWAFERALLISHGSEVLADTNDIIKLADKIIEWVLAETK